jgi:hypothetical protein
MRSRAIVNEIQEISMSNPVLQSDDASSIQHDPGLRAMLEEIQSQLANLVQRVAGLEELASMGAGESVPAVAVREEAPSSAPASPIVSEAPGTSPAPVVEAGISEEEVLAISAAVAAWLGVQAHIRQIRLIRTGAWAQQGRVTIQTSHRLNY